MIRNVAPSSDNGRSICMREKPFLVHKDSGGGRRRRRDRGQSLSVFLLSHLPPPSLFLSALLVLWSSTSVPRYLILLRVVALDLQ